MPSCAMFDYDRVASAEVMGLKIKTEKVNGAVAAATNAATPVSPSRAKAAFGRSQPFFIGVAGGTASGKTTVCDYIMQRLHDQCVVMLSQDSFYRGLTPEEHDNVTSYNFDHPDAFDMPAIVQCMDSLKQMQQVDIPVYDFNTHQRSKETRRVEPADVVIIEGIMVLHMPEVKKMLNMKIFVDTDDDVRLARRIQRDIAVRGRDVAGVIDQYTTFVKPMFDQYVAPSRKHADVIIPWASYVNYSDVTCVCQRVFWCFQLSVRYLNDCLTAFKEGLAFASSIRISLHSYQQAFDKLNENAVAIDLITQHIRMKLQQPDLRRIFHNLEVIPSNYQIRGMHTIIRDVNTNKTDFVFYADRLLRLVVEAGLGHLPFAEKMVVTPTGSQYVGVEFAKKLCGVSIIRSGESMENALRACCKGIKIGKILVHRHQPVDMQALANGHTPAKCRGTCKVGNHVVDQELIYEKLPGDISQRHVLLMDPILATGNSAARAIQVLLSKGVEESKILFLSLIAAPEGIHRLCSTFPRLKVITSDIDEGIGPDFQVVPGVGEFGDRYFCD